MSAAGKIVAPIDPATGETANVFMTSSPPTWTQPWACVKCQRFGAVDVTTVGMRPELGAMGLAIQVAHAAPRPGESICTIDISNFWRGEAAIRLGRMYRDTRDGRIFAQHPFETPEEALAATLTEQWPPWRGPKVPTLAQKIRALKILRVMRQGA